MNQAQQRTYKEILARFERNLEAVKRLSHSLHERLSGFKTSVYGVDIGPDGEVSIQKNGAPIYAGDARSYALDQVASFDRAPVAFRTEYNFTDKMPVPPASGKSQFQDKFLLAIQDAFGVDRAGLPFVFDHKHILYIQVYGVGAGYHIEELIRRYDITYMALHETEFELFYCSLFTADWCAILEYFDPANGRTLSITFGAMSDKKEIFINIREMRPDASLVDVRRTVAGDWRGITTSAVIPKRYLLFWPGCWYS